MKYKYIRLLAVLLLLALMLFASVDGLSATWYEYDNKISLDFTSIDNNGIIIKINMPHKEYCIANCNINCAKPYTGSTIDYKCYTNENSIIRGGYTQNDIDDAFWKNRNEYNFDILVCRQLSFGFYSVGNKYVLVNNDGKAILNRLYDKYYPVRNGIAWVKKGNLWGGVGIDGNTVIDFKYEDFSNDESDNYRVKCAGKWGVIDRDDKVIVEFEYDYVYGFVDGGVKVRRDGRDMIISSAYKKSNLTRSEPELSSRGGYINTKLNSPNRFSAKVNGIYMEGQTVIIKSNDEIVCNGVVTSVYSNEIFIMVDEKCSRNVVTGDVVE